MMKRSMLYILCAVCVPVCIASIVDNPETADGYLTEGEYVSHAIPEGNEELFVMGGGAFRISARDYSYLEVQYTSTPLSNSSGIYDIMLYDNSDLLYLDGITEEITVRDDAAAALKGGRVDYITIYHLSSWQSQVTIYCQDGYQKDATGVSGLWQDGTSFDIEFINVGGVFAPYPTANYVNVIPEPTTLLLFGLGGLLLRHKR